MSSSGTATVQLVQRVQALRGPATLGRGVVTSLVAFHGWLLWRSVEQGAIFERGTAGRWLLAVVVLLGFAALRRRTLPLFRGRRALVLWLLVFLIHTHAALGADAALPLAVPEAVSALSSLALDIVLVGVVLLAVLARRHAAQAVLPAGRVPAWFRGLPAGRPAQPSSPRPPPLA